MGCISSKEKKEEQQPAPPQDEYVEGIVCQDSDIAENEMKAFDLKDEGKVLLVRQKGKLHALGAKCTHYGAPLQNGALGDGRIRCQWHGACFNIATGDIEDFPGLDSLPCYQVTVENNNVKVRARKSELQENKRIKPMIKRERSNPQAIVIIGGGPASLLCAETLRQEGYKGKITMVAKEKYLPYDRIKVSKAMDFDINKSLLRPEEFYFDNGIDVLKGTEAVSVDTREKSVNLSNGESLKYDQLFIATGSKPGKLKVPGADLHNVIVLRDFEHSAYIQSQIGPEKHVVIVGSSFIGMEAANYLVNKVGKVTVTSIESVPFEGPFGYEVGAAVKKMFEEKGIHFIMRGGLKKCIDNGSGAIGSVELPDGTILQADLCIMGVGTILNTEFLKDSGIALNPNGSIEVDQHMQTNIPDVFAGGDVVNAPVWCRNNQKAVIGHWGLAHMHGRVAALNMLKKKTPLQAVPYFWSMLFGKGIRYAGNGKFDDIVYHGNVDELKFVAFYLNNDDVVGISSCQMDPVVSQYGELLAQGKQLRREDIARDPLEWTMATTEDYVEGVVCKNSDIKENEMKAFKLNDEGEVLLVRQKGKLYALGTACTHYGAPLEEGALGDGRLRCQWHGACFDLNTGDIEDFPGLDSLPCYKVTVENDDVKVCAKRSELKANIRVKSMVQQNLQYNKSVVIVGGGPSGAVCAETLRQEGFRGKITLVAKEKYLPYDRIKLSKILDSDISSLELRKAEFYKDNGIDVITDNEAVSVDVQQRTVKLKDTRDLHFDQLYIATGSTPRKLNIPGAELKNVVVLREYEDTKYIYSKLSSTAHVVILGTGFIGMELANYCIDKVEKVTVVGRDTVPFKSVFGQEIGAAILKLFQEKKVHFVVNSGIKKCVDGGDGSVASVELNDGTILKADICIMGIGSTLNTKFLENSAINLGSGGSVDVNEYLQTNVTGIYAGGDIANAPVWSSYNEKAVIGHYGLAQLHGRTAALNMVNKPTQLKAVPLFWTRLFEKSYIYVGHGKHDSVMYHGNVDEHVFVAFYLKGDEVIAISTCQIYPVAAQYGEYVSQGKKLYRKDLEGGDMLAWTKC